MKPGAALMSSAGDLAGLEALGANLELQRGAVDLGLNALQVRLEDMLGARRARSPGAGVDMSDIAAILRTLVADRTRVSHQLKTFLGICDLL